MPSSVWIILANGVPLGAFSDVGRADEIVTELAVITDRLKRPVEYAVKLLPLDPESVKVPDGK